MKAQAADRSAAGADSIGATGYQGEFEFSERDFKKIADIVKAKSGIELPSAKASLVYSRLTRRLRTRGLKSFTQYCDLIEKDSSEMSCMLSAITTNVTKFYREAHHFEHLQKTFQHSLSAAARRGERIRLWSSACSTGQEPYSMALAILGVLPEAAKLDIRILATDLNPNVVEHGRNGIYSAEEVQPIPSELKSRWLEPVNLDGRQMYKVADEARSMVAFRELNLMEPWPIHGPFQAIFCRNVVIYFEQATQSALWQRFTKLLAPHATLYIGHSERLSGPAAALYRPDGITTFQLRDGVQK